jgi:hypothetical protein
MAAPIREQPVFCISSSCLRISNLLLMVIEAFVGLFALGKDMKVAACLWWVADKRSKRGGEKQSDLNAILAINKGEVLQKLEDFKGILGFIGGVRGAIYRSLHSCT